MNENRIDEGRFSEHAHGVGTVTEEMVRERARELAMINGRPSHQVLGSDYDEARRELTGPGRLVPPPTAEEEMTEDERWEPVHESVGRAGPTVPAPDEQTFAEKLVEEGVEEAEHDEMLQSARQSRKEERESR